MLTTASAKSKLPHVNMKRCVSKLSLLCNKNNLLKYYLTYTFVKHEERREKLKQYVNGVTQQCVNGVTQQYVNGVTQQCVNGVTQQYVNGVTQQCVKILISLPLV